MNDGKGMSERREDLGGLRRTEMEKQKEEGKKREREKEAFNYLRFSRKAAIRFHVHIYTIVEARLPSDSEFHRIFENMSTVFTCTLVYVRPLDFFPFGMSNNFFDLLLKTTVIP